MTWTTMVNGTLITRRLTEQEGYIDIYMGNQEIVKETDIVLHMINLLDIEHILDKITENINLRKMENKEMLMLELNDARNKLMTLFPKQHRHRRGLINGIGNLSKWLFGTMDDEDRQIIQNHLSNINEIKENNNQQVFINEYFNTTLNHLKIVIQNDRKNIEKELNSINKYLEIENNKQVYLEQFTNIQLIKNKIEDLQDNIISAKYGIVHPSILTSDEIKKYKIDFTKLRYIQVGTAYLNQSCLVFGVKIPKKFVTVKQRIIVPIPNNENYEIDYKTEKIIGFENQSYTFKENKYLKELELSKHCLIKNNCQMIKNIDLEILQLDIDTIIVKNSVNISIEQTCNVDKIVLNGNYLINFNNCSVKIKDYYFSNIIEMEKEIQINQYTKLIQNFTHKFSFTQMEKEHKNNIKNIMELKYHNKLTYGCNTAIMIIIIIVIIFVVTKHQHIKIKLNNRIQENSKQKGGVVTYKSSNDDIDKFLAGIGK